MRILFTFIGGLGHLHPLVPLARAAVAAGHEVAVAGSGSLVPRVEAAGFTALATSPARASAPRARDLTPLRPLVARDAEVEFAENFADQGARRHARVVGEHLRSWRPDVVVRDEADLGTAVAAEVAGVPVATVLVLAAGTLVRPDLVVPRLDAVRAEHGLPPDPGLVALTGGLSLVPFAPSFRSPTSPLPLGGDVVHFRPGDVAPRAPGSRRRVYATLGTEFNVESGDLLERLVAGLGGVDADVLLTVGHEVDPAELGHPADHVRVERFVPQAEVLPTSDVVVSHGGSGSLLATLAHGLPSVLLPLGADQPHNTERAVELGVARTLDAATATPGEVAQSVTDTLSDESTRRRAQAVAEETRQLPGVAAALAALEAL